MSATPSNNAPLIPMSEIFMSGSDESPRTGKEHDHRGSVSHVLSLIEKEIIHLNNIQSGNNDDIKKKLTEIQTIRESNLVVVGALGGLKRIREKL